MKTTVPRALRIAIWGLIFTGIFIAGFLRLPYYAIGPGPARDVTPLIRYDESAIPRYDVSGRLIMTTVSWHQVTPLLALRAWVDDDWTVVPQTDLFAPGTTREEEQQRAISDMDQSKLQATALVLSEVANYPKDHGEGTLIDGTIAGCPADGKLFPGDLVTTIDGRPIVSLRDFTRTLDAYPPDTPMTFSVTAGGEVHDIVLRREPCGEEGDRHAYVGVVPLAAFPLSVSIQSGDVGGPSAGLMWALGLYDLMTPGDLTEGRTIAGTGTIQPDGSVGPIGGITDKIIAARNAGASIFLAPKDNMSELEGLDTGDMQVVSVSTFDDALAALGQHQVERAA